MSEGEKIPSDPDELNNIQNLDQFQQHHNLGDSEVDGQENDFQEQELGQFDQEQYGNEEGLEQFNNQDLGQFNE